MRRHYSERAICEIVWLVASEHVYNMTNLGMRSAGVSLQIVERLEVLWFAECEFALPFTNSPNKEALNLVNMMKPVMNGLVFTPWRTQLDGTPMFSVSPSLVI
jgi:hypothetical protein